MRSFAKTSQHCELTLIETSTEDTERTVHNNLLLLLSTNAQAEESCGQQNVENTPENTQKGRNTAKSKVVYLYFGNQFRFLGFPPFFLSVLYNFFPLLSSDRSLALL